MEIFSKILTNTMVFLGLNADDLCNAMDVAWRQDNGSADDDGHFVDPSAIRHWKSKASPSRPGKTNFRYLCSGLMIVCNAIEQQRGRAMVIALKKDNFIADQNAVLRTAGAPFVEWDDARGLGENVCVYLDVAYYFPNDRQNDRQQNFANG